MLPTILLLSMFSIVKPCSTYDSLDNLYSLGYEPTTFTDTRSVMLDGKNATLYVEANRNYTHQSDGYYAVINSRAKILFDDFISIPLTLENGTEAAAKIKEINASASLKVPVERFLEIVKMGESLKKEYSEDLELKSQPIEPLYDGPVRRRIWHNYTYLEAPGNGSIYIKYDQLDTLWTYYEGEIYRSFALPDENYPIPSDVTHIHNSKTEMDDILNEADWLKFGGVVIGIVGPTLGIALLLASLSNPLTILLAALIAAVTAAAGWVLELFVRRVWLSQSGDAFSWLWSCNTWTFLFYRYLSFKMSFGALRDLKWNFGFDIYFDTLVIPHLPSIGSGGGGIGEYRAV